MKFNVPDMSCGHCTAAIEKAIKAQDPGAAIDCDLDSRTVSAETSLSEAALSAALEQAGYAVKPLLAES
ncbi:heavy-metal-associated domain-containing protein [Rhodovulum adriaticum]|uniref:Copper chaperone n=1 Tax=Rhodovulum adriaticum TaxID=35804 RepID=A0A4R2NLI4_RHOAD|nr:heavy-metal-associated domain-containing protein [Rhodovulum adriaticum]MBK1637266.1 heavy metal-binding protein [Rhodovulum adriaticum]TCP22417.1 copper chaperone [Rhodovulum adriaticum]